MALKSLGVITVTTAATRVRATATSTPCQSIFVQAVATNTGKMYVGNSAVVGSTLAGCFAVLPAPVGTAPAVTLASFSASIPLAPGGLNLADIWIDSDTNGEKVLI